MANNWEIDDLERQCLSDLRPTYSRSKEDVWTALEKMTKQAPKKNDSKTRRLTWFRYSAAASVAILIGMGLFARFYSTQFSTPLGQLAEHKLPDGSVVHLNAESSIEYHPYWWSFDRQISLKGEAFFRVKKGQRFQVNCQKGSVEVLGTSFNVFSRADDFKVFCKTGKVRVLNQQDDQVILTPGESSSEISGKLSQGKSTNPDETLSWRLNKFNYNSTPISKVIEDFQRHYNVEIRLVANSINELNYTGIFSRDLSIEEALNIVCYSFEMKVEKTDENSYIVQY